MLESLSKTCLVYRGLAKITWFRHERIYKLPPVPFFIYFRTRFEALSLSDIMIRRYSFLDFEYDFGRLVGTLCLEIIAFGFCSSVYYKLRQYQLQYPSLKEAAYLEVRGMLSRNLASNYVAKVHSGCLSLTFEHGLACGCRHDMQVFTVNS